MENIKSFIARHKREVMFGVILFFVASLSFGLGYIADQQFNGRPIIIEKSTAPK